MGFHKVKGWIEGLPGIRDFVKRWRELNDEILLLQRETASLRKDAEIKTARIQSLQNEISELQFKGDHFLRQKEILERIVSGKKAVIAFAVTEAHPGAKAGDYFTALEFSRSLEKLGHEIRFLSWRGEKDWYDIGTDVDVLIVLLHDYDISGIYNKKAGLLKIAWARNWFEGWCEQPSFGQYDIVLASSRKACAYIEGHSTQHAVLFPIAANTDRFNGREIPMTEAEKERFSSDYAFTGSYWDAERDITRCLEPEHIPYTFKIYGANWEQFEKFRNCAQGFLEYEDIPKVYKSIRILIDDANHTTKPFGSVNSRVFDALAAGTLVITNGKAGSEDTFGGLLPSYSDRAELEQKLTRYLSHDAEREQLVRELQRIVLTEHTYDIRAKTLTDILKNRLSGENSR